MMKSRSLVLKMWMIACIGWLLVQLPGWSGEDVNKLPPLKISVRVPESVRKDLVNSAVEFCLKISPGVSEKELRSALAKYVNTKTWKVEHLAGNLGVIGPIVEFEKGALKLQLSFPGGHLHRSFLAFGKDELPASLPANGKPSLAWSFKEARKVFPRLIPQARRKAYRLYQKKTIHGLHRIVWLAPLVPGHSPNANDWLEIEYSRYTGQVAHCWFQQIPLKIRKSTKKLIPAAQILRKAGKLYGVSLPQYLGLYVWYYMGRYYLCWLYRVPHAGGQIDYTAWDAKTGELVFSNAFDAKGKALSVDPCYQNFKYFPYRTTGQIKRRLQELAADRAKELAKSK